MNKALFALFMADPCPACNAIACNLQPIVQQFNYTHVIETIPTQSNSAKPEVESAHEQFFDYETCGHAMCAHP